MRSQIVTAIAAALVFSSLASAADVYNSITLGGALSGTNKQQTVTLTATGFIVGPLAASKGGTGQDFSASSGVLKYSSGTASLVTAPSGAIVGTSDSQTLTNKTISGASNTLSNIGTSSITGLAASATTDTTNAANIGSGTLPSARISATTTANQVLATPNGSTGNLGVRALVVADLFPGGCTASQIAFENASNQLGCSSKLTWTDSTATMTLGSAAVAPTITVPAVTNANGLALTFKASDGNGTSKNGGNVAFTAGNATSGGTGGKMIFTAGTAGSSNGGTLTVGGDDLIFSDSINLDVLMFVKNTNTTGAFSQAIMGPFNTSDTGVQLGTTNSSFGAANQFAGNPAGIFTYMQIDQPPFYHVSSALTGVNDAYVLEDVSDNFVYTSGLQSSHSASSTDGFFYVGKCGGAPTGVPAHLTGDYALSTPLCFDETHNRIYGYNAAWKGAPMVPLAAPTIASGFGTSPSVTQNNGPSSFSINVGTGGTANSGVITLAAAPHSWACSAEDQTTVSSTVFRQRAVATSATSVTITNLNTSAAAAAWTASDVLQVSCWPN